MPFWNNDLNYIQDVFTHSHSTKCQDCTYKLMRSVQICFSYDFSEYLMSNPKKVTIKTLKAECIAHVLKIVG